MLVLSRKVGERIRIGEGITVTVVRVMSGGVRLGIEAPKELPVVREELHQEMEQEQRSAVSPPIVKAESTPTQDVPSRDD